MARSPNPSFGWIAFPKFKLWRLDGKAHPLHALVESNAKNKRLRRLDGKVTRSRLWLNWKTKSHALPRFDRASASDFPWCTTSFVPGLYGSFSDTNLRRSYPSIERGTLDLTPTAPEDRTHQFHLHLFQWMMDRRSHVVHRTLVNINSSLLGQNRKGLEPKLLPKIVVARGTHDSVFAAQRESSACCKKVMICLA